MVPKILVQTLFCVIVSEIISIIAFVLQATMRMPNFFNRGSVASLFQFRRPRKELKNGQVRIVQASRASSALPTLFIA